MFIIGNQTNSMSLDDFEMSLLSHRPVWKHPVGCLEACCDCQKCFLTLVPHLSLIIQVLPDHVDSILHCRTENLIQMIVAAANTSWCEGHSCAIGLLATIKNQKKLSVVKFYCQLYPSGCSIVIKVSSHIMGIRNTIYIRFLLADPYLTDCLVTVWQTGNYSIHNWGMVISTIDVTIGISHRLF